MENNTTAENTTTTQTTEANTTPISDVAVNSNEMSEHDALMSMLSTSSENESNNSQTNNESETPAENMDDNIDLSSVDLSFLGIQPQQEGQEEIVETPQPQTPTEQNNPLEEIKDLISGLNQNNQPQQPQMDESQKQALTELFDGFKQLGLIPETFGMSEEDKALLQEAKEIKDNLKAQEDNQKAYAEHQTKLSELDSFSKKLETTIPGYSTEFMQKVVGDINKSNPEAGQKIFNNPSLLIDLWNQVGAKSQPKQNPSNVISSNGQQSTNASGLEQKVLDGTATEKEEAMWLLQN